jgi:hypothetical protein
MYFFIAPEYIFDCDDCKFMDPGVSKDFPVNYIHRPLSIKYLRLNYRQNGQYH